MAYDGSLKFDTEIGESGFNAGVKKLSSIAKTGMKAVGVAVGAASVAFAGLTKASLASVASLEQNVGGIETLFKDSAQTVIDNANRAFETAGMSANDYMQNVTSFSASLLQSVAGDTKEAARVADMAMIDMSDNANKMGSNMEDIKNAYQGFAKQNYTMLDNLKLGYGGTKTEMERLLSDAEKITGVKYDISNLNDVYEAIHVIQENLGITGTTAKEAATTIEGSMNAAKASFDNLLNGSGSAEEFADSVTTAAENIYKNLMNIIPRLASELPKVGSILMERLSDAIAGGKLDSLADVGGKILSSLTAGIAQALPGIVGIATSVITAFGENLNSCIPTMLESGVSLIESLASGALQAIPVIAKLGTTLITELYDLITSEAPRLLTSGYEIISNLVDGIVQAIPEALPKILDFVQGIGDKLAAAAPVLIQKGFELLQKLVEGITTALPILIAKVPTIISTFANIINDNFPVILMKGVQLLGQLGMGILQAIPTLIANIPQIITAIVDVLMAFQWLNLGKTIITGLGNGIKAMGGFIKSAGQNILNNLKSAVLNLPSTLANLGRSAMYSLGNTISGLVSYVRSAALRIVSGIESAILRLPGKMLSIGRNIVQGLWNGISDMTGWIISKIQGFGDSVLSGIKKFFGIHSPSRVFRDQVGKMLALGLGIGFEKNLPLKSMQASVGNAVKKLKQDVAFTTSVRSGDTVGKFKNDPSFFGPSDPTDYDRLEQIQMKAADRMAKRPIYLGTDRIDKPLPEGAVPAW
jgi:phage-related protein